MSEEWKDKFQELNTEAARQGISTRELVRRRHIEALKFARDNGSQYAQIAIEALEQERY